MQVTIRPIEAKDNKAVETLIRYCLKEFGGDREGTAWTDPYLNRFSEVYAVEKSMYWVAENENGRIVAGVGIGPLEGVPDVCELQKMYSYPEVRGSGIAQKLVDIAFEFAKKYYAKCYLETFDNMKRARNFYLKNGFYELAEPLGDTGHYSCPVRLLKEL